MSTACARLTWLPVWMVMVLSASAEDSSQAQQGLAAAASLVGLGQDANPPSGQGAGAVDPTYLIAPALSKPWHIPTSSPAPAPNPTPGLKLSQLQRQKGMVDINTISIPKAGTCTCQPCGCNATSSCAGLLGCAPVPPPGGFYGGDLPPAQRPHQMRFGGKTIFITGGSSGVGFKVGELFTKECGSVAFMARGMEKGMLAEKYFRSLDTSACSSVPRPARYFQGDVRNLTRLREVVAAVGAFTYVVNSAGVAGYGIRRLVDIEDQYINHKFHDDVISINLVGTIFSMKVELQHLIQQCKDTPSLCAPNHMINVAGLFSVSGMPRSAPYAAAQAGIANLCRSIAAEYRPPVQGLYAGNEHGGNLSLRVQCISPGFQNTRLTRNMAKSLPQYGSLYPWQCWKKDSLSGELYISDELFTGVSSKDSCYDIRMDEAITRDLFTATNTLSGSGGRSARIGDSAEVAGVIMDMLSDTFSFARGNNLVLDDGFSFP